MTAIDKLAKLAAGFRGTFLLNIDAERALGLALMSDDGADDIATFECDDHVADPFVDMLNAIAPALAEVAALRAELAAAKKEHADLVEVIDACRGLGHGTSPADAVRYLSKLYTDLLRVYGTAQGDLDETAKERDEARAEIAALRAALARRKTAADSAESVHAALGVSSREAARAAMERGVPCPTCGAESHTEAKGAVAADRELDNPRHPAPCVHLDRAHDGSCFGCGSDENNPNPEATP